MTQEDKELLLKDLSARLPYGVICRTSHTNESTLTELDVENECAYFEDCDENILIINIKPYLRPMSSMTEEEKEDFELIREWSGELNGIGGYYVEVDDASKYIDFLNSHQFDYRGLIEKGLALEAPEEMYNIK